MDDISINMGLVEYVSDRELLLNIGLVEYEIRAGPDSSLSHLLS